MARTQALPASVGFSLAKSRQSQPSLVGSLGSYFKGTLEVSSNIVAETEPLKHNPMWVKYLHRVLFCSKLYEEG